MSFVLPNPGVPQNGQSGDATPILANELAIAQAISSFDGSQVQSGSIQSAALANNINPQLRGSETLANFVYSGCLWSLVSGFSGTMTGGTIYVNGFRTIVSGVGANTFAASSDTYVDIDNLGNIVYLAVANGATASSLTANSLRVAKVVTNGSAITTITQFGSDGIGNILYPIGPDSAAKTQNPCKFRISLTTAQNTSPAAFTRVLYDTKQFDTGNNIDIITNKGRFTAPAPGFYHFDAAVNLGSVSGTTTLITSLFKNGSEYSRGNQVGSTAGSGGVATSVSDTIQLAQNDTVDVDVFCNGTVALSTGAIDTFFSGFLVSAT